MGGPVLLSMACIYASISVFLMVKSSRRKIYVSHILTFHSTIIPPY